MKYLSLHQIVLIHSIIIDETGGTHGIRDRHSLFSLVALPKQKVFDKVLYPTLFLKAAIYVRNILFDHPFIDGNKRTAITAAFVFLENNGYVATAAQGALEKYALHVVVGKLKVGDIALWLERNSESK